MPRGDGRFANLPETRFRAPTRRKRGGLMLR
jgi:hypothetical protein